METLGNHLGMAATLSNIPPRGRKRSIGTLDDISTTTNFTTNSLTRSLGTRQYATTMSTSTNSIKDIKDTMEIRRAKVSRVAGPEVGVMGDQVADHASVATGSAKPSLNRRVSTESMNTLSASTSGNSLTSKSAFSNRAIPIPQPSLFYEPERDATYGITASGPILANSDPRGFATAGGKVVLGRPPMGGRQRSAGGTLFPSPFGVDAGRAESGRHGEGTAGGKLQSKFAGTMQGGQVTRNPLETKPTNFIAPSSLLPALNITRISHNPTQTIPKASIPPSAQRDRAMNAKRPAPSPNTIIDHTRIEKRPRISQAGINAAAIFGGEGKTIPPRTVNTVSHELNHSNADRNSAREAQLKELARQRTADGKKRAAVAVAQEEANEQWRSKYAKAWPSFVFHFDASIGEGQVKAAKEKHRKLGGRVDDFFSSKVTHIITLKDPVKAASGPATSISTSANPLPLKKAHPLAASVGLANITRNGPSANGLGGGVGLPASLDLGARGKTLMSPFKGGSVNSMATPAVADAGVSALALKAMQAGKKVWTLAKLNTIFDRLAHHGDTESGLPRDHDLSFLLEDEKLHGTRERDLTARRPDWYYFPAQTGYLLVEDATGEHRPMMAKQYDATADTPQPWPRIFETFMKPSENALRAAISPKSARLRALSLYVDRVPFRGEQPPTSTSFSGTGGLMEMAIGGMLNRTTSLANLKNRAQADATRAMREESLVPYQGASGNTISLTSNVASTSTAMSSAKQAQNNPLGVSGVALGQNKQLAQISKRIQVNKRVELLKSNMAPNALEQAKMAALLHRQTNEAIIAAQGEADADSDLEIFNDGEANSFESTSEMVGTGPSSSEEGGASESSSKHGGKGRMDTYVREMVLEILKKARAPAVIESADRAMQAGAREMGIRLENTLPREKVDLKPGYCENCRMKYEDFETHIDHRRHRRFAEDDSNFADLDDLLDRLERPPLAA